MIKVRFLFVLFSLIVLAAPARAQSRGRDHGHGRGRARGDVVKRDRDDDETGDRRAEDGDRDDDNRTGRVESDRRRDRDDDEDDDGDDDSDRGGVGRNGCTDANGNNVCDVVSGSVPATLPEMVNAILISRGQLTRTGRSWLGAGTFSPRFDRSANRTPRQVTWADQPGSVREVWLDRNGDGRADVARLYRSGKLVRTVQR